MPGEIDRIDRSRLRQIVEKLKSLSKNDNAKSYTWHSSLKGNVQADAKALYVSRVGLVNIPFESNDIEKLAKAYPLVVETKGNITKACCLVSGSEMTFIPQVGGTTPQQMLQRMTYGILENVLDMSFDSLKFDVEANLEKLIVCRNGESYESVLSTTGETGKFGTLFIQIPLKVDKPCGTMVMHDGFEERTIKFESNSCFSVAAAVAVGCNIDRRGSYAIQSGSEEVTAVMVFSLIWNDCSEFFKFLPTYLFPELLILTNQLKQVLMPWYNFGESPASEDCDEVFFLCLPITSDPDEAEADLDNLSMEDAIAARSLMRITFIDTCCATVQPYEPRGGIFDGRKVSKERLHVMAKGASFFKFEQCVSSSFVIAHDVTKVYFPTNRYLVADPAALEWRESLRTPVVVIQARNQRFLNRDEPCEQQWTVDDMFYDLDERLENFTIKEVNENPMLRGSFLKDLEQVIELLKKEPSIESCIRCFITSLFNVFTRLKATELAVKLLQQVLKICKNVEKWFVCDESCLPDALNPVVSFVNFIRLVNGWETFPEIVKHLLNQLMSEESFHLLSDIGLYSLQADYLAGAGETFNFILQAVSKWKTNDIGNKFNSRLVVLAIHLQEADTSSHQAVAAVLKLVPHLEPHQLTDVVKDLGRLNSKSPSYVLFMNQLSSVMKTTCLFRLSSQQFLEVVAVYGQLGDKEVVQSFWTSVCAQCVCIYSSNLNIKCLFCDFLRNSADACKAALPGLIGVAGLKEAVYCSIQKLPHDRANVNFADLINFVVDMGDNGFLSDNEVFKNLTALFSCLSPEKLCNVSCSLFQDEYHLINDNLQARRMYEWMLEKIVRFDVNVLSKVENEALLQSFAWFGSLDLVKRFVAKFKTREANGRKRLSTILNALKVDVNGFCAAASSAFNRKVFNFLMLECLKTLEGLENRTNECIVCFKLIAASERSFIDPIEAPTVSAWTTLTRRLTFFETAEIVKKIFQCEIRINNKEPKLRNFSCCWQLFIKLCNSVVSKWDVRVVRSQMSENYLAKLVQSFMWTDEEKTIADLCRLINEVSHSVKQLVNVHKTIVSEKLTLDMATDSQHALFAFNDLIDYRIQTLSRRLTEHQSPDYCSIVMQEIKDLQVLKKEALTKFLAKAKST